MRFCDLNIGDTFKFSFEKDSKWVYKKIDYTKVQCVEVPNTESRILNRIDTLWMDGCYYMPVLLVK